MIGLSPGGVKIMVATQPIDFRRLMNGLVASALAADPYCGDVFVFRASVSIDFAAFIGMDPARS